MIKRFLLAAFLALCVGPALAQNPQCPTRPPGDTTNACASTAFVQQATTVVTPEQFGCVGDGVTDDAACMQNAINAAAGKILQLGGNKNYLINSALSIATGISIIGQSRDSSLVTLGSATQDGFDLSTTNVVYFANFKIVGNASASNGSMILYGSGSASPGQFSTFRDLWLQGGFVQFNVATAAQYQIENTLFAGYQNVGLLIADSTASDAGDMSLTNSTFTTGVGVGTAILQTSAGGLKATGNKFIQGANGYVLQLATGVSTSELYFVNNSMEAYTASTIKFTKSTGTLFGTVTMVGNSISSAGAAIDMSDSSANWLNNITITGNVIACSTFCVNIHSAGSFVISSNVFQTSGAGTPTGINIDSAAANGIIANNLMTGMTTDVANASTSVMVQRYVGGVLLNNSSGTILNTTAIPAGGTAGVGYKFSSTANFGTFFGSGAPTLSAAQGSLYLRSDGGAFTRGYINTNGSTGYGSIPLSTDLGAIRYFLTGVNFNSGNTDNPITITLPPGVTRWRIGATLITNASASISTATAGVFTGAGGTGATINATQAITVTASTANTLNNMQLLAATNGNTMAYDVTTVFFRVVNPQGSAATADVEINITPL